MMTDAVQLALESFRRSPHDDARRQVLADALLEAGDPRGEYIALVRTIDARQHSGNASHRAQELLRHHSASWLSDLEGVFQDVVFKGGFPDRARLDPAHGLDAAARARRSLSALTLTHVGVYSGEAEPASILRALPSLTSLALSQQCAMLADQLGAQLTSLSTTLLSDRPFPNLRTLTLDAEYVPRGARPIHLETLVNALALQGLELLTIVDPRQQLERCLPRWDAAGCRRLAYPPHLELERLEDRTTRAVLVGAPGRFLRTFARLAPASLRFVKVVGTRNDESLAKLRRALPRAAVEFLRP